MGNYLFGADFGTSGVKVIILNHTNGKKYSSDLFEYPTLHKKPLWAEQRPNDWWCAFCDATRQVLKASGVSASDIEAIGVSSQGCGVVCVDDKGETIDDAMIWMDSRTDKQCNSLKEKYADEIYMFNGNPIQTLFPLPSILWLQKNRPQIFDRTKYICGVSPYINFKLTDTMTVNPSEGSLIHLYDVRESKWSKQLCEQLDISQNLLPETCNCTDVIGEVSSQAAKETGLAAGTTVIGGGHDTTSAALGVGVSSVGQVFYSMGTGSNLGLIVDAPRFTSKTTCQNYVIPGTWIFNTVMTSTGVCMKWLNSEFGSTERLTSDLLDISSYDLFNQQAIKAKPGSGGVIFLPYLAGEMSPIWDENARACFIGMTNRTKRADIIRSVMEGVCFSAYHNMTVFEENDCDISEFRVAGGPTKSNIWMQILADITGKEIVVSKTEDAAPLGNAMLAGISIGVFENYKQACEGVVKIKQKYRPNTQNNEIFKTLFEVYKNSYLSLKEQFKKLSEF